MNTQTLKVGQTVLMGSGVYGSEGKVVEVSPSGVVVQKYNIVGRNPYKVALGDGKFIRFDLDGKACNSRDIYQPGLDHMDMDRCGTPGTYECGPWELIKVIDQP